MRRSHSVRKCEAQTAVALGVVRDIISSAHSFPAPADLAGHMSSNYITRPSCSYDMTGAKMPHARTSTNTTTEIIYIRIRFI